MRVEPHRRIALYCHSGLPDDLGIQYQSFRKEDIIAADDFITLHPGLGHTGSEPFDETSGWYRSYRGLAGRVTYAVVWKGWTIEQHSLFPVELKKAVVTMLLCEKSDRPYLEQTENGVKIVRKLPLGCLPSIRSCFFYCVIPLVKRLLLLCYVF